MDDSTSERSKGPEYATFTLRARALVIDAAVVGACLATLVVLFSFLDHVPGSGRIAWAAMMGLLLLYEPVLVWRYGATVGHRRRNICVVSDTSGGPPSFPRSFLRFLVKGLLGLPSFVAMALTSRHQAFHDVVTGTTVQIRDRSLALSDDFVEERVEAADLSAPTAPVWRRVLGVMLYAFVSLMIFGVVLATVLNVECLVDDVACTRVENALESILGLAWLAVVVLIIILGWRWRLPGFGRERVKNDIPPSDEDWNQPAREVSDSRQP